MVHLLIVILHDLSRLPALLDAWKRIGVPGVTLINSVGGFQAETWLEKIGLGGISRLFDHEEIRQRTLFSVIADEELLEMAIAEADTVVEGFDRPHSGILFSVPVGHALGIRKWKKPQPEAIQAQEAKTNSGINRQTPVSQIVPVLNLEPVIVQNLTPLSSIIQTMLEHPCVHMACVVNEERRLVGLIDLTTLANGFFFSTFPEAFLGELQDLDQALQFAAKTRGKLAADLMQEPGFVKMEDTLDKAFKLMHSRQLPGLPVVDDHHHITGYINLLELMGVCLRNLSPGGNTEGQGE